MSIHCVAVYCGAHEGKDPEFMRAASELGKVLAKDEISLVYGAGHQGIMGAVSRAVVENGGKVTGVIPKFFQDYDYLSSQMGGIGELVIKEDMHARKKYMSEKADAFIALPGGYGTMEELVEAITWIQLGIHTKPIGILNVKNYYKGFLEWIETAMDQGFIKEEARDFLTVSDDPMKLVEELKKVKKHRANSQVWSYTKK